MLCTTSKTEGEVGPAKLVLSPSNSLLTVPRRQFCCGSLLPVFGVRLSVTFSSVSVAEWPPFGKQLFTRLTICYLCILTICNISYFPFWF